VSFNRTATLSLLLAGAFAAASVAEDPQSSATPGAGTATLSGPGALSDTDKEVFLRTAEIQDRETVPIGVTKPQRARLDDGTFQHDAHIQTVDISRDPDGPFRHFRDCYKYNVAAYRLATLLGFDRVPVSVERKIGKKKAAVTWWVDDVAMMEVEREDEDIQAPDPADFDHQMWQVRIFSQLVHNTDLNPGNVLITNDWKLWLVDFTRAFRVDHQIDRAELAGRICRSLYRAIHDLEEELVRAELQPHLTEPEIEVVLKGRDEIVAHYDEQVAARGEAAVFCDEIH
jgi:hypothetical protein